MFGLMMAGMVGSFASSLLSASSQRRQGEQAQANANAQAQAMEDAARDEEASRAIESVDERTQAERRLSGMEARYAKSGLAMSGTPVAAMVEQAQADEFNILSRDRLSSIKADDMRYQGGMLRYQGAAANSAAKTNAWGSIIGGVAQVAGTGANYGLRIGGKTKLPTASAIPEKFTTGPFNSIGNNGMLS